MGPRGYRSARRGPIGRGDARGLGHGSRCLAPRQGGAVALSRVRFHPAAREELTSARDWYDRQRAGLGAELVDEIERAVEAVCANPRAWPSPAGAPRLRRFVLPRFPYSVLYAAEPEGGLLVVALAHTKRRPGYWRGRLG